MAVLRRLILLVRPSHRRLGDRPLGADCFAVATIGVSVTATSAAAAGANTHISACTAEDVTYDCPEEVAYDASTIHSAPLIYRARYAARLTLDVMDACRYGSGGRKFIVVSSSPSAPIQMPMGPIANMLRFYTEDVFAWAVRVFTAGAEGQLELLPNDSWKLSGDVAESLRLTGFEGHQGSLMGIFRCVLGR